MHHPWKDIHMSKAILALTAIASCTIVTGLFLTDPITQSNRYQAASLRRYQQQSIFDAWLSFYDVFMWLIIVAIAIALVITARAFYVRYVDREQLHEQRMLERDIWLFKYENTPQLPNLTHLTYSPRTEDSHNLNITQHHKQLKALPSDQALSVPTVDHVQQVPTFKQALADATGAALVLGYDQQAQPVHGTLDSLYSFGIGGMSGSGKSSTAVWLLAQSVLQGAKLIVIDPHAGNSDSLASKLQPLFSSYLCKVASTQAEMLQSVRYSQSIFNSRKSGETQGQHHVIVVCDEWLACMRGDLQTEFQKLAESISQEGRKYGVIGCFLSQKWSIQKSGDMRDTLTSHIICRTRPNLARQQTGLLSSELPSDVMSLDAGQFYLLDTFGELQKLTAPYVSDADLTSLVLPTNSQTTSIPTEKTQRPAPIGSTQEVGKTNLDPEEARILQLFLDGLSISEITRQVSGAKSGRKYSDTLNRINVIVRQQLRFIGDKTK